MSQRKALLKNGQQNKRAEKLGSAPQKEVQTKNSNGESTLLASLYQDKPAGFVKELQDRMESMGLEELCAFVDKVHLLQSIAIFSEGEVKANSGNQRISNLSVYEDLMSNAIHLYTKQYDNAEDSIFAWIREAVRDRFVGTTSTLFHTLTIPITERQTTDYLLSNEELDLSYSVLLTLKKASNLFPRYVGQSTSICLSALRQITRTCLTMISRLLDENSSRLDDYVQLVYTFKLGLLFCVLVEQNESLAKYESQRQFFLGSCGDSVKYEKLFTESLIKHSTMHSRYSMEFSRFSVYEPRCLCELAVEFFEKKYKRQAQSALEDILSKQVSELLSHAKLILARFQLPVDSIGNAPLVLANAVIRPPCIQKFSSRYVHEKSAAQDQTADPDFTSTVSKNSFEKQLKANQRKRSMQEQRREKDEHVDTIDTNYKLHSLNAQTSYKKLLHELQGQEHAMKTVDHHKALAMKGKQKKKR
ncbi:hypothetical protein XU18_2833 [Perkinsela sp. CCAP 1560/4]|nr:hypothetical protein XU18_2833 [Perkinsela sp. CCAP 1560/4]|eukprot:KNH06328.1 hypothetical protein XU18_2833 [Perkinsela sp. CCAP 1560/4]